MKKILFITTISGFLPQFEMGDVRIMQELGYEVHYASNFNNPVYSFDENELINSGIVLHRLKIEKNPIKLFKNVNAIAVIKKIIDEEKIDIVHCHNPMGGVVGRVAGQMSKRKPYMIYTAHGLHFYSGAAVINWCLYYPVEKILARMTDSIVTINKEDYMRVRKKFHLRKGGFVEHIHGVGIDMNRFNINLGTRNDIRKELDIPNEAFHIITAAELNDNKNQKVIIKAISLLNNPNIYYSICGKGPNEKELEKYILELGLEKNVKLCGFRTDMECVLQSADAFAFPSIREGLGIAAVEALACGVPVVAADNRGTREYVMHNSNGFICDAHDEEAFTDAIKTLYEDEKLRQRMSAACRNSVTAFSKDNIKNVMLLLYKRADRYVEKQRGNDACCFSNNGCL